MAYIISHTMFTLNKFGKYEHCNRRQSFNFMGPRLFNTLPKYLRSQDTTFPIWKSNLDKFLERIPDNPVTVPNESGLCELYTAKQTNSLIYWIPHLGLTGRRNDGV